MTADQKIILFNYSDELFAKNLLKLRLSRGLTRIEISEILGKDQQQIRRYEDGEQMPPLNILSKICDILCTTPNELMGISEIRYSELDNNDVSIDRIYLWIIRNVTDNRLKATKRNDLFWECPKCKTANIEYNIKGRFEYDKQNPLTLKINVSCCKCLTLFDRIHVGENANSINIYRKAKNKARKK